jgi:hypothetical protein
VRLEGANEDNVEKLLQSHGEGLTNDELQQLAQQRMQSEFTASDATDKTTARELLTEFLNESTTAIPQITNHFTDNNPDYGQCSKASQRCSSNDILLLRTAS